MEGKNFTQWKPILVNVDLRKLKKKKTDEKRNICPSFSLGVEVQVVFKMQQQKYPV